MNYLSKKILILLAVALVGAPFFLVGAIGAEKALAQGGPGGPGQIVLTAGGAGTLSRNAYFDAAVNATNFLRIGTGTASQVSQIEKVDTDEAVIAVQVADNDAQDTAITWKNPLLVSSNGPADSDGLVTITDLNVTGNINNTPATSALSRWNPAGTSDIVNKNSTGNVLVGGGSRLGIDAVNWSFWELFTSEWSTPYQTTHQPIQIGRVKPLGLGPIVTSGSGFSQSRLPGIGINAGDDGKRISTGSAAAVAFSGTSSDADGKIELRTAPNGSAGSTISWNTPSPLTVEGTQVTIPNLNSTNLTVGGTLISASPWTKSGAMVYLTNPTDNVGIGTQTPSQALTLGPDRNFVVEMRSMGSITKTIVTTSGSGTYTQSFRVKVGAIDIDDGMTALSNPSPRCDASNAAQGCAFNWASIPGAVKYRVFVKRSAYLTDDTGTIYDYFDVTSTFVRLDSSGFYETNSITGTGGVLKVANPPGNSNSDAYDGLTNATAISGGMINKTPYVNRISANYKSWIMGGALYANSYLYVSDRNLKENIKNLDTKDSQNKLLQLQGVSFDWKNKGGDKDGQIGLIAQDVEKVFPEVVSSDAAIKSIEYAKLIAPMIETIKAQQKEIEELKKNVAACKI